MVNDSHTLLKNTLNELKQARAILAKNKIALKNASTEPEKEVVRRIRDTIKTTITGLKEHRDILRAQISRIKSE